MSHDCCKKCGEQEPVPYRSMRKICDLPDCPQRLQKEFMDKFLEGIPKHESPFKRAEKND